MRSTITARSEFGEPIPYPGIFDMPGTDEEILSYLLIDEGFHPDNPVNDRNHKAHVFDARDFKRAIKCASEELDSIHRRMGEYRNSIKQESKDILHFYKPSAPPREESNEPKRDDSSHWVAGRINRPDTPDRSFDTTILTAKLLLLEFKSLTLMGAIRFFRTCSESGIVTITVVNR